MFDEPRLEIVNSLHRHDDYREPHQLPLPPPPPLPAAIPDRIPSPILPSLVITNSGPATGNGFTLHPESEPPLSAITHPLIPDPPVKVENHCAVNGRRTSRDKSPAPPPLRPIAVAVVKTEPSQEPELSKEELRCVLIRNQNMRQMIYKEVKRPGKDYSRLFQMLKDLHGPPSVRRTYSHDVISEARRFKRETLVDKLEKSLDDLVQVV